MPLSKTVLLMSARLPRRTVHALKTSSGRPCRPQANMGARGACEIRLCHKAWGGSFYFADGPSDGLCDRLTHLNRLEKRQLQLYSNYCWPAKKDGSLQAGKDHHQCTRPCWSYNQRSNTSPQSAQLNHDGKKLFVHLKVLVIALLPPWHKMQVIHRVSSSN